MTMRYVDRKRQAAQYHRDLVAVNVAKGLELAQRQRGELLTPPEHSELELTALLSVYLVALQVTGFVDDEAAQGRIFQRATKLAEEKLGTALEVLR
jgi:hypothetical protein